MKTRLITGSILVAVVAFFIYIDIFILNFIIFSIILALAFFESLKLYALDDKNKYGLIIAFILFAILPFLSVEEPFSITIKIIVFYITFIASVLVYFKAQNLKPLLPFIYPTAPIFLMFSVYNDLGMAYFVWMIIIIALSDSGAYFIGKTIGKTPFTPTSPNKTIEGVIGGLCISLFPSILYAKIFTTLTLIEIIIISLIIAVFGVFGDLFESWLKRKADVKDSGNLFPGHGGILDRIDGYLFGAIAMFLVFAW